MAITWQTPAGNLGTFTERQLLDIPLDATTDIGTLNYSVISGSLPNGLRLDANRIKGSPSEVVLETTKRFVVRASNGTELLDRTFSITIDGEDSPEFITPEGFLNVGEGEAFFVLDNAPVDFQIQATDPDLVAGESLSYYLVPNGGELPPGLSLSADGRISGFTDPVFSVVRNTTETGAFDTHTYDTISFDIGSKNTTGFDTFFYDNQTFDFSLESRRPRRLSRIYTFAVGVTDGKNTETRIFKIYVVTTEFLRADNNILEVDTNLFQADATGERVPFWITDSNLGRYRSNNYVTLFLDVYDPPSLPGVISYFIVQNNPDGTPSTLPPGMAIDNTTGEIAGVVPYQSETTRQYQFTLIAVNFPASLANLNYTVTGDWNATTIYNVNDAVRYEGLIYIALQPSRGEIPEEGEFWTLGVGTAEKTFTIEIIGDIDSSLAWQSNEDLGTIRPNEPGRLFIEATTTAYGGTVIYSFKGGSLPPGLTFLPTGIISGKVKQFGDEEGPGLTRFFESDSALQDSSQSVSFDTLFDSGLTTFDKKFTFTAEATDFAKLNRIEREFSVTVDTIPTKTFANVYVKALMEKQKRLAWFDFITDAQTFPPRSLYRDGDPNYGVQTELRILVFAGIESVAATQFVQAMSRNHYRKRLYFGDVEMRVAKDPATQEIIYEVVFVRVKDEYEKNGKQISNVIDLKDNIDSPVLVSYDAITIDSDIPFVSDRDHQRIFPNSIENMRDRIEDIGDNRRELLPLWMRSIQNEAEFEPGYSLILPLCYAKPGEGLGIINNIRATDFDFKSINFEADRYIIDIIDGVIEDKYIAFPQRREKKP